ncbi:hypothetical protein ACH5RR_034539 [Cinchona calisaya]|uniref:Uncharacterized protein n=1 Tax=Cinchona calisaya TaxID=153742 RepID=A0ABD2YCG3_9GENT
MREDKQSRLPNLSRPSGKRERVWEVEDLGTVRKGVGDLRVGRGGGEGEVVDLEVGEGAGRGPICSISSINSSLPFMLSIYRNTV